MILKSNKQSNYYKKKSQVRTPIQDISAIDLENVLSKVISNFDENNVSESLNYAGKFDSKNIVKDTSQVYAECINHVEVK